MKIIAIYLYTIAALTLSQQTSANIIFPGKISSFNDGNLDGWAKGPRSNAQPEILTDDQGHQYLQVTSFGELTFESERDPDSRLRVLNHTNWLSDYNLLGIVSIKVRMANLGEDPIHMRLFFGNTAQEKMCMSATAVQLDPDKQWHDITFSMEQPGLVCGTIENTDRTIETSTFSIAELKKNLNNIFFMSLENPDSDGKLAGTLGIDFVEAQTYASLGFIEDSANQNQLATIDLHTDVIANNELIQHINNTSALTSAEGAHQSFQVNNNTGLLVILSAGKIETLRPVSAIMTEQNRAGVNYSEDGYKQLFTENNRRITTFAQSNAKADFSRLIQTFGLAIEHDQQGNLAVFPQGGDLNGQWFSVRVDSVSNQSDAGSATGLSTKEYSNLPGVTEFIHSYSLDNAIYQQSYHAVPANWQALKKYFRNTLKATNVRLSSTGIIALTIGETEFSARVNALVNPQDNNSEPSNKIELQGAGDINKDGLPDFKVLYANGQSQIIYLLP